MPRNRTVLVFFVCIHKTLKDRKERQEIRTPHQGAHTFTIMTIVEECGIFPALFAGPVQLPHRNSRGRQKRIKFFLVPESSTPCGASAHALWLPPRYIESFD